MTDKEPFGKLLKAEFELRGLDSLKHAAHLQYKLMLLEPVVRAHVSFPKKTLEIIYSNPTKNTQPILSALKPVRAILKSKQSIEYSEIVRRGYHS
jgi:hypothetical protein